MNYNRFRTARSLRVKEVKKKPKSKKKIKPKKYPLDEFIEQIWYDDWLKKQEAKGIPIKVGKHYWKVGGSS
tara:strand:+ start:714 stop:926 length:213 start_codon:yes stop_codon:yes gene_type:complete